MKIIRPPRAVVLSDPSERFLFLAGSIEMGKAETWQTKVEEELITTSWTILNPRRDTWDPSWKQTVDDPQFSGQVNWELDALSVAHKIFVYFSPNTKSPITLLELGLYAKSGKLLVCCPDGFWRRGNVQIVCKRYSIPFVNTLQEAIILLKETL